MVVHRGLLYFAPRTSMIVRSMILADEALTDSGKDTNSYPISIVRTLCIWHSPMSRKHVGNCSSNSRIGGYFDSNCKSSTSNKTSIHIHHEHPIDQLLEVGYKCVAIHTKRLLLSQTMDSASLRVRTSHPQRIWGAIPYWDKDRSQLTKSLGHFPSDSTSVLLDGDQC